MENSRLKCWHYHAPILSYLQLKEDPEESLECMEPANNGYFMNDGQAPQVPDDQHFMKGVLTPNNQTHLSKMRSDDTGNYVIIGCTDVTPKPPMNSLSHRQRQLPMLTRIKRPSRAHLPNLRSYNTADCVVIGCAGIKTKPSMDGISQKQPKLPKLTRIKRPALPPLKRIISLPPLTTTISVTQYTTTREEVRGVTPQGTMLTTCTDSKKEMRSLQKINTNDNLLVNQRNLQEPKILSTNSKSSQISLELLNSKCISNLSPINLKRSPSGMDLYNKTRNTNVTKLQSSINQTQETRQIVQNHSINYHITTDVNPIGCNKDSSRETNQDYIKTLFKKPISVTERKSPVMPSNIFYLKEKVYSKSKLKIHRRRKEEYRCTKCGYRSRYLHHFKMHIKCHNFKKHKKKQKHIPALNIDENNDIYPVNKIYEQEEKIPSTPILPRKVKINKKKNLWQKCPFCLYISNSRMALKTHINHSHEIHRIQKNNVLYIKIDNKKKITNDISKNSQLRMGKKRESARLKIKRKETCTLCSYETYSLSELNLHLQSHIPHEFQKGNNVEKYTSYTRTSLSPESNPTRERRKCTIERSVCAKANKTKIPKNRNYISGDTEKLKKSKFISNKNNNISSKITESIKDQEKNEDVMIKQHNNKQNLRRDKIGEDAMTINNKFAEEGCIVNKLDEIPKKCIMDIIEVSDDASSTVEEDNNNVSDTETTDAVSIIDCDGQDHSQAITDVFKDQDEYLLKEDPKKTLLTNKTNEGSQTTETAELWNLEHYNKNKLPDLPKVYDKVVEDDPIPSPSPKKGKNNSKIKSENNILKYSDFRKRDNKIIDLHCPVSSACFKNNWSYRRHIKRSHKECNECSQGKQCAYKKSNVHPELIAITEPFECSECCYVCTSKGNFIRHIWTHSIEKQLECNICGYRCRGSGQLQRHLLVHKGGGKYFDFWPLSNMNNT